MPQYVNWPDQHLGQQCAISRSSPGRKVLGFRHSTRRVLRGHMRRRDFIKAVAGSAAAWPLAVRAQQSERKRRVGVLMGLAADDPEAQDRIAAFEQGLQQLGWTDGGNLQIDYRRGAGESDPTWKYAAELVALAPDVILASGGSVVGALLQATRTVPIVFTQTPDPVAAGFVSSLARPGGNATGFTTAEYGISGKWLELLKEIAPAVTRVAVVSEPPTPPRDLPVAPIPSRAASVRNSY